MASSLMKAGLKVWRPILSSRGSLAAPLVRSYWNKDWMPGPYPKTPQEREAAAKKYGLRPEDYEPYPDDGMGHGDYPMLPRKSIEVRDPYENWDYPEFRRNFGEPLHVDADVIAEDRWAADAPQRYSYSVMIATTTLVAGSLILWYCLTLDTPHHLGVMPKQYPKEGVTHYTFEAAE